MVANDDAHCLMHRAVLAIIAGKPAPTGPCIHQTLSKLAPTGFV